MDQNAAIPLTSFCFNRITRLCFHGSITFAVDNEAALRVRSGLSNYTAGAADTCPPSVTLNHFPRQSLEASISLIPRRLKSGHILFLGHLYLFPCISILRPFPSSYPQSILDIRSFPFSSSILLHDPPLQPNYPMPWSRHNSLKCHNRRSHVSANSLPKHQILFPRVSSFPCIISLRCRLSSTAFRDHIVKKNFFFF